jgi:hypothetical protein
MSTRFISRRHVLKSIASGFGYLAFASLAHEAAAKKPLAVKPPHFLPGQRPLPVHEWRAIARRSIRLQTGVE